MVTVLSAATTSLIAQQPTYLQDVNGLIYGPYEFKTGETVRVGTEVATIVHPSQDMIQFQKTLEETKIPEVDFRQAPLNDVVRELRVTSRRSGDAEFGQKEVSIILDLASYGKPSDNPFAGPDPATPPLITFSARYISVLDCIKIVTAVAALDFRIHNETVTIYPKYRVEAQHPPAN